MHISKCHMDTVNVYNSYLSVIFQYKWKHFLRLIEASKIISEIFYIFFHTRSLTSHWLACVATALDREDEYG